MGGEEFDWKAPRLKHPLSRRERDGVRGPYFAVFATRSAMSAFMAFSDVS
jgi:hypothetical protein